MQNLSNHDDAATPTAPGSDASFAARCVETHLSRLVIDEQEVTKRLKPLRHAFADLRSLEHRRKACEAEFALGRRFAPDLYTRVVPIAESGDAPRGRDAIVDYAICMRRIPDGQIFADLAVNGELTEILVERAVTALSLWHAAQAPVVDEREAAAFSHVVVTLAAMTDQTSVPCPLRRRIKAALFDIQLRLDLQSELLTRRRAAGFVRRGHGDYHLGNICVFHERVTPFDPLAFDDALATCDVLYDLAFLLMDLRAHGLPAFANRAMNAYFDEAEQDEHALALLSPFMALRALVRSTIACARTDHEDAERYLRLAVELLAPSRARLVAVGGLSGSGKSSVARDIAPLLPGACGARLLRTDIVRRQEARRRARVVRYTATARRTVYRRMIARAHAALTADTSAVLDGTFLDPRVRAEVDDVAQFDGIWLDASTKVRLQRILTRHDDASEVTLDIAMAQVEPPEIDPPWRRVEADGPRQEIVAAVAKILDRGAAIDHAAD